MSDTIRSLTRPALTALLVVGFLYAALSDNVEAVKYITPFASMALGFWFGERGQQRAGNGG